MIRRFVLRQPLRRASHPVTRLLGTRANPTGRTRYVIENLNLKRMSQESYVYHQKRRVFLMTGAFAGVVSIIYTSFLLAKTLKSPIKADSSLPSTEPPFGRNAASRKVVVHDQEGCEIVPTGNKTVPEFPRTITLGNLSRIPPTGAQSNTNTGQPDLVSETEYTLVGLGLRSVSFIGIGVYMVGYYVATSDIAALQNALIKRVNPIATTLVAGERKELQAALLHPVGSEEIWNYLLEQGIPARSVFRIVPVRDTDFRHLSDGFARAISARTSSAMGDETFGETMGRFKALFHRGSMPRRNEMILHRDAHGRLTITYKDCQSSQEVLIGAISDERLSRALWLNYLAGKRVASEPARSSIIEGLMELVKRPVGTVVSQIV